MSQSHFADASGYTAGSVSTPADLLKVASAAMGDPAFAQAVSMPSVTLPLAGTVESYTPLLPGGTDPEPGVVGVKSGFTTAAGGGDILAYRAVVGGRPLTVLAAVSSLHGPGVLDTAGHMALTLAQAAVGDVRAVAVTARGVPVGRVTLSGRAVPVVTARAGTVLAWPGQRVRQTVVVTRRPRPGSRAGTPVGTALFTLGEQQVAVGLRTAKRLPAT
jgi:D-alanyl-D-alanine carboxypeptidase (penicillin-binding protein 5/6)